MAAAASLAAPFSLLAQSPDWTSTLSIQPFPSPYVSDWERVPTTGLLSVTYTGIATTDFVVSVTLTSNERGLIGTIESPGTTVPGGPVTLLFNARDAVFDWNTLAKNRTVTDQVSRTGQIPEGRYRACATVLNGVARVPVSEACAEFTILLPDPPQLVTPAQDDLVRTSQPFFSWTPVVAPPDIGLGYRLRLVEVIGRQAPSVALAANIPLYDEVVLNAPFLLYPLDGVPLEAGKRYTWQVTATNADGQQLFRDKVASEIHVFSMAPDLLGPLGPLAQLGDTAVVQPGVAVLRGLSGAQVRADLASGSYVVNGTLSLALVGLPGAPVISVQANDLRVGTRGQDVWLVGGDIRVARPRNLLPQSANGLATIRQLFVSPARGVTATIDVGAPGQGSIELPGSYQLTALGWYGRQEGTSSAPAGFASIGRAQLRLALTRARFDLPSGALEIGARVNLLGAPTGCDDIFARADDGVLHATVSCRATGAVPMSATGPTDFLVETMAGQFTADMLADTLGYDLVTAGRVRLFGGTGAPCHVEALLRFLPDSVATAAQTPRCGRDQTAQPVAPWLTFRYDYLQIDSLGVTTDGSLRWRLRFQVAPELAANPAFPMPVFANAYATRDSIVFPELSDFLGPDAAGTLDQFRIIWRRAAHDRVARLWGNWEAADARPFAWRFDADALFEASLTGLVPCLATRFKLSPVDGERIRLADGRLRWNSRAATYDDGCTVAVAPGVAFTTYRLQGPVDIDLAMPARTSYPTAVGVLENPIWPPPVTGASSVAAASPTDAVSQWVAGAFQTASSPFTSAVLAVGQALRTATGILVNGVNAPPCNTLTLPIDGRGRLIGSAAVQSGCGVALGIGKMTPYAGRFTFGTVTSGVQEVRWTGGARISMDSTLAEFDAAVKSKQDSVLKATKKDAASVLEKQVEELVAAWAKTDPQQRAVDSLQAVVDSLDELYTSDDDIQALRATGNPADVARAAALEARNDQTGPVRDRTNSLLYDLQGPAELARLAREKVVSDSLKALQPKEAEPTEATTSTISSTPSLPGGMPDATALTGTALEPPGPQEADSPDTEIDWQTGRIIRGRWIVRGPFVVQPIPGLAFRVKDATIDQAGLRLDGNFPLLYLKSADSATSQWAGVRLNLVTRKIESGLVSFSQGLAMEIGTTDKITTEAIAKDNTVFGKSFEIIKLVAQVAQLGMSTGDWMVRPPGVSAAVVNGVRIDVAERPVLDARGLSLRGVSPLTSSLFGSTNSTAKLRYSDDFALRNWTTVSQGSATLEIEDTPVAIWTAAGWRPAVAELIASQLPARLPLPNEAVAYVQLRDAASNDLLVNVTDGGATWRLSTPVGPVKLVVPALAGLLNGQAPSADVSFDLEVDKTTFALTSGSISASVRGVPGFDLAAGGVPFALETVRYDRDATAGYRLTLEAGLALIGEGTPTGRVTFTVDGNGQFDGTVALPLAKALDLGTPEVQLQVDELRGAISGNVATGLDFQIDAVGGVRLALAGQQPWFLGATLRLSPRNAQFVDIRAETAGMLRLGVPGAAVLFGNPRIPLLAFDDATKRVRFDMLFDLGVEFAALSNVKIPTIRDIHIRDTGIDIPAFEISEISDQMLADDSFGAQPTSVEAEGFAVRPLALRVGRFNWIFGQTPNVDVRIDLELGLTTAAAASGDIPSAFKVRVLDLGWRENALRGTIEPVQWAAGLRTPFGNIRSAWGKFALGAQSEVDLLIGADLTLPDIFGCEDGAGVVAIGGRAAVPPKDTLRVRSSGRISGIITDFVPPCSGELGPVAFRMVNSRMEFDVGPDQQARAVLDGTARVAIATGTGIDSARADGRLAVNLITGEIVDASIEITQPFVWQPDPNNPLLAFRVNRARLDRRALTFTGGGELRLAGGGGAALQFNELAWAFREQQLISGSATVQTNLAVGAEIGANGLVWGAFPATEPPPSGAGFRLTLPAGMVIDRDGVGISGTATATLAFGDESFTNLSASFENGFRLATTGPVRVLAGQAVFKRGTAETIATVDETGFRPGDLFAVLPIPDRLPLPNQEVAYLVLGDATRRFVELSTDASGRSHLRTPAGKTVDLFLPALAYGGPVPKIATGFDLIVEPRTMQVIGGSLLIETQNGSALVPLPNLPVDITRLGFALGTGGWQLKAGARVRLPGSLSATPLVFQDIVVERTGLSGAVQLGTVTDRYVANAAPIVQMDLRSDSLSLAITGARLDFAPGTVPGVSLAGVLKSALLKDTQGLTVPLWMRGSVSATGFEASADLSAIGNDGISLGVATLRPTTPNGAAPIRVVANAQRAAVEFGASLELTAVSPGLIVAIDTIHIGSDGLRVSPLSIAGGNAVQFQLFGLNFALQDSTVGSTKVFPALAGRFDGAKLNVELSGRVTVLENTTRFYGLRIGSDGTLALAGASLISRPIPIVPQRLSLDTLRFAEGSLRAAASVLLPAPFETGTPSRLFVTIAPDGRVSGGGTVVLVRENEGLESAQKKLDVGIATFHIRYLAASVDFERPRERTSVDLVSDIYIANKPANLIRLGAISGNTIQAGLRITPTGVTWSGLEVVRPMSVDAGPVRLTLESATAVIGAQGLSAAFSGKLGLAIEGTGGGVPFEDVKLQENGELTFNGARFSGGSFTIAGALSLNVTNVGFSDTETEIEVPGDNARPINGRATVPQPRRVRVKSYLSFGADVTIVDVFNGGVKRVLIYQQADDNTNHILVEQLTAKVSEVFELKASMRYDEYPDGFTMQVAGSVLLMEQSGLAMVGVISKRAETVRAGLFLAVSAEIPIIPGVFTLASVGGGFFINPEPSDLDLVRQVAGIEGGPAQRLGSPPAGKFAIMLYAKAIGVGTGDASLIIGQVLVTVTDLAFRLDGNLVFLGQEAVRADVALQIGWEPQAYLIGDMELKVEFPEAVSGTGRVTIAIGGNAFAVKGKIAMTAIKVLQAEADVVVTPSGFVTAIKVTLGRTFWVVRLQAQLKGEVWFRPSTNDLGAYVEITGEASIPGLIGIEAYLRGALIVMPEFALYAAGGGRVYVLGAGLDVSFWLSISGRGFGGGLGENAEMNAAIARARAVADELRAEADSIIRAIQNQVSSLTATPAVASEETLRRVFDNAKGWANRDNWLTFYGVLFSLSGETVYEAGVDRTPYFKTYLDYLTQRNAPSDTTAIAAIRAEAQQKLAVLAARRDEMLTRIADLQASIDSVRAVVMPQIPNPVRRFTLGDPSVGAIAASASGGPRTAAEITGLPVFDLDDVQAADNRATMTATAQQVVARQAEVARMLLQAQASLDGVREALSATQSSSLMGYLRLWADAVEATERQHATTVDYQMRRWKWTRDGLGFVRGNREAFRQTVQAQSNAIINKPNYNSSTKVSKFDEVATARVNAIALLGVDPAFAQSYQTARAQIQTLGLDQRVAAMKQQVDTLAMQLYSDAGAVGLAALDATLPEQVQASATAATAAVQRVRSAHAEISGRAAVVSDAQLELYGAVYDLYDAVLRELPATDSLAQRITLSRNAIRPLLNAPQIGAAQATVQDFGFLSKAQITFSATHPAGVPEYTITEADGLTRSLGSTGNYTTWRWSTDLAGGSESFNGQLGARAAGGTRTTRGTPAIAFSFARGTPAAPTSTNSSALVADVTPPSAVIITAPGGAATSSGDGSLNLWVTKGQQANLAWSASDAESGIQEYRYRVIQRDPPPTGTVPRTFGPIPTELTLAPALVELVPWTSLGGRNSMLLLPPTPAAGKIAQVEIIAINGVGLQGAAGQLRLREDATPPVLATTGGLSLDWTGAPAAPGVGAPAIGAVCTANPGLPRIPPNPAPSVTGVVFPIRPRIDDPESGIVAWYAKVDSVAPTTVEGEGWTLLTDTARTKLTVPNVPYEQFRYVAVAARNGAGAFSRPIVTPAPMRLHDPSVAPAPVFCLSGDAGRVAIRITQKVADPESGIRGYQLRLRTPAGAVLRDWPAGATVDLAATVPQGDLIPMPSIPLPVSGSLVAELRAINGSGVGGHQAASGPLYIDGTPPPAPMIEAVGSVVRVKDLYQVVVTLSATADPESGFGGIDVRIDDSSIKPGALSASPTLVPWTALPNVLTRSTSYTIGLPSLPAGPIIVFVRARNGVGMTSLIVSRMGTK